MKQETATEIRDRLAKQFTSHSTPPIFSQLAKRYPLVNEVLQICNGRAFLAGGSIKSLLSDEEPSDFDFFFVNSKSADEALKLFEVNGFEISFVSRNALTLSKHSHPPIQLITNHYYTTPQYLLMEFDLTISMAALYYGISGIGFMCKHDLFVNHLGSKTLVCWGRALSSLISRAQRIHKFMKQGFVFDGTMLERDGDPNPDETIEWIKDRLEKWESPDLGDKIDSLPEFYEMPPPYQWWTDPQVDSAGCPVYDVLGETNDFGGKRSFMLLAIGRLIMSYTNKYREVWSDRAGCVLGLKLLKLSNDLQEVPAKDFTFPVQPVEGSRWYYDQYNPTVKIISYMLFDALSSRLRRGLVPGSIPHIWNESETMLNLIAFGEYCLASATETENLNEEVV